MAAGVPFFSEPAPDGEGELAPPGHTKPYLSVAGRVRQAPPNATSLDAAFL